MDKKGESNQIGLLLVAAISIIVGLILLQATAGYVSSSTTTGTVVNKSLTLGAAGATITVPDAQAITNVIVINNTASALALYVNPSNYTILNYNPVGGVAVAQIKTNTGAYYASQVVNVSYSVEPIGYVTDSGSRTVATLIIIFGAIAIAVFALWPAMKGLGDMDVGV